MKPTFVPLHTSWTQLFLEQSQIQKQLGERELLLEAKQKCLDALALWANNQRAALTLTDICWYLGDFKEAKYWIESCQSWSEFKTFPPYRYSNHLNIRPAFSKVATMKSLLDLPIKPELMH